MLKELYQLVGFGPTGWGWLLLRATAVTFMVALCGFLAGAVFGVFVAWAKLAGNWILRSVADAYTTVFRGVPDLLVIYLFYFGSSSALNAVSGLFGASAINVPVFLSGVAAIGIISGAYQAEVFRGSYHALNRGELEAARSVGMHTWLMFRRVVAPQVLRYAIPSLGNVWQLVLKESALLSVIGVIELLRQSQIGAGATGRPFDFYITAALLYLFITWISGLAFAKAESQLRRGVREPN